MRNSKVQFIVHAAMIAAIYVVLTYFISAFNLASGAIQVRISEALTILPYFTPAAIPVLRYGYGLTMEYGGRDWSIPFYMLTVGAGEIICCCVLGTILLNALAKVRNAIFKKED